MTPSTRRRRLLTRSALALALAVTAAACVPAGDPPAGPAPVYMVISIHSHLDGDAEPTTDPATDAVMELITRTRATLDTHGFVANWHTSYGVAGALCASDNPEGQTLLTDLDASGHEVGIHTHGTEWVDEADAALAGCGIEARSASGIAVSADAPDPHGGAAGWLETVSELNYDVTLTNLGAGAPALDRECGSTYGGTAFDAATGNVPHPWRPDVTTPDVCAHDPNGPVAVATHVDFPGRTVEDPAAHNWVAYADQWREWRDGILEYAATGPNEPVVWGIVWPFTATFDERAVSTDYLRELGDFLAELEDEIAAGTVVPVTASQLVDLGLA